jgi:hypothetical protein
MGAMKHETAADLQVSEFREQPLWEHPDSLVGTPGRVGESGLC